MMEHSNHQQLQLRRGRGEKERLEITCTRGNMKNRTGPVYFPPLREKALVVVEYNDVHVTYIAGTFLFLCI